MNREARVLDKFRFWLVWFSSHLFIKKVKLGFCTGKNINQTGGSVILFHTQHAPFVINGKIQCL